MIKVFTLLLTVFALNSVAQAATVCGTLQKRLTCHDLDGCPQYFLLSGGESLLVQPAPRSSVALEHSVGQEVCVEGYYQVDDSGLFFAIGVHAYVCHPNGCGGCRPSLCI